MAGLLPYTSLKEKYNMTKIIYFLTPTSIIKVGTKAVEFVPIVGPFMTYAKKATKATELSNPVSATSRGIGLMFNHCFGKVGAITIECALWFSLSVAGGVTGNPVLIAGGAECGNLVLDEILD